MRVFTGEGGTYPLRFVPNRGITGNNAPVNPVWAGEPTRFSPSFLAFYPRVASFTVSIQNLANGQKQDVISNLASSYDKNGNRSAGYDPSGVAFLWTSGPFNFVNPNYPFSGGVVANSLINIYAGIEFPFQWPPNSTLLPLPLSPPIPNPPITNFYFCMFIPGPGGWANETGANYKAPTIYVGNMYPDNNCPGFGVPDTDPSWSQYFLINMRPSLNYGTEIITKIVASSWENID